MSPRPKQLLIAQAGETLYGARWQSAMARDLSVALRTVQRWAAGEIEPGADTYRALLKRAKAQEDEIPQLIAVLTARSL